MTTAHRQGGKYAWLVLVILTTVNAFNFVDRQILAILAPFIKVDFHLTDAQIGLLYGTAFGLFYCIFGIPLGRIADRWVRTWTIALGLTLWSGMTGLSGLAASFAQLSLARLGVGVGEASASPAAYSLLSDYFPPERRATVLSIYSSGVYVGGGISLMIGGTIVGTWDKAFPHGSGPLGLTGWHAAFLAVSLPGLILALIVALLREPPRGTADPQFRTMKPWRDFWIELFAIVPPFTLLHLYIVRASRAVWRSNLTAAAIAIVGAGSAISLTDRMLDPGKRPVLGMLGPLQITTNVIQWVSLGVALYGLFSWIQSLKIRDRPAYSLTWASPAFLYVLAASGFMAFLLYAVSAWAFVYASRVLGAAPVSAGITLGLISVISGGLGTTLSGVIGDRMRRRHPSGRLYVGIAAIAALFPIALYTFNTREIARFYAGYSVATAVMTMWLAPCITTCQDLVLPRMRGIATASLFFIANVFGLALGPYTVGLISDSVGSLRTAILLSYLAAPAYVVCLLFAARIVPKAESGAMKRALLAGEQSVTATAVLPSGPRSTM